LNGQKYDKSSIRYETINEGGLLEFIMGPNPQKAWGSKVENRPIQKIIE